MKELKDMNHLEVKKKLPEYVFISAYVKHSTKNNTLLFEIRASSKHKDWIKALKTISGCKDLKIQERGNRYVTELVSRKALDFLYYFNLSDEAIEYSHWVVDEIDKIRKNPGKYDIPKFKNETNKKLKKLFKMEERKMDKEFDGTIHEIEHKTTKGGKPYLRVKIDEEWHSSFLEEINKKINEWGEGTPVRGTREIIGKFSNIKEIEKVVQEKEDDLFGLEDKEKTDYDKGYNDCLNDVQLFIDQKRRKRI